MFSPVSQMRELVFSFDSKTCTGSHPSGRYDKDLVSGDGNPCTALADNVPWYLNMSWGDTDEGAPYYISWQFYTLVRSSIGGIRPGNGSVSDTITGLLEVDGVGTWALTCSISYDLYNPTQARISGGYLFTTDTSIPTGYTYPDPYNVILVGSVYSGRVRVYI